jgi:hypothetical protein
LGGYIAGILIATAGKSRDDVELTRNKILPTLEIVKSTRSKKNNKYQHSRYLHVFSTISKCWQFATFDVTAPAHL